MKTYILNLPNEIRNWSNALDAKAVLCSRSWNVLNDEGVKEVYVFQKDGILLSSRNGAVTKVKWEFLSANSCILLELTDGQTYMLRPSYYDEKVLVLQVDGTSKFALMVVEKYVEKQMLETVDKVQMYITDRKRIEAIWDQDRHNELRTKELAEIRNNSIIRNEREEWMRFIDEKVETELKSPFCKSRIDEMRKKKNWCTVIFLVYAIVGFVLYKINVYSEFATWIIVLGICGAFINQTIYSCVDHFKNKIRKKIIGIYPFELFKSQNDEMVDVAKQMV